jgi:hypothetical protein
MFAVKGIYDGNTVMIDKASAPKERYNVVVTFLEPLVRQENAGISEENTDDDTVIMERIRQRLFRKPSELSGEEKLAALNRITGIIKGPVDLDAIREERLSRQ